MDAHGQSLAYFYVRDHNDAATAGVLTMDEGAANGEQLRQAAGDSWAENRLLDFGYCLTLAAGYSVREIMTNTSARILQLCVCGYRHSLLAQD